MTSTSSTLRDKARAAANGTIPTPEAPPSTPPAEPAALAPMEAPEGVDPDAESVPVRVAIIRMMRDLGKVAKSDKYAAPGTTYNFRGVDRVVNAVAPLLRKHGVLVLPEVVTIEYRDVARKEGARSHECVVTVRWHWIGPAGDEVVVTTAGEALDTSDKAAAKAQSVAWRVCLIQTLAIPTGDPDPDSVRIDRGEMPVPLAKDYRDEALRLSTSPARLLTMRAEVVRLGIAGDVVPNEHNDDEKILDLINRIGRERSNQGRNG